MTAMPAVRLCCLIVLMHIALVQSTIQLNPGLLFIVAMLLIGFSIVSAARESWGASRTLGCLAVACMLSSRTIAYYVPSQPAFETEQNARIEGHITKVYGGQVKQISGGNSQQSWRCIVDGEVDAKHLPAIRTRTLLRVRSRQIAAVGSRIVVSARIRRPDPATLPNEFDEQAMCRSLHASFVASAIDTGFRVIEPPSVMQTCLTSIQSGITDALSMQLRPQTAAVLSAVIIGDESQLDRGARQAFAQSGTAHMFSVSGSHVATLIAIGLAITVAIRRRWLRTTILALCIVLYVLLSGGSAPAWRAAVMGLLALWGRGTERDVGGLNVMAAGVFAMVALDPLLPWSASFQLSVCATCAIIVLSPRWNHVLTLVTLRDNRWKRVLRASCAITLAATAGTSLPSALIFDQVAVWSPLANLLVVPLLSTAMISGTGLIIAHYVAPWLAPPLAWTSTLLVDSANGVVWCFATLQPESASGMNAMIVAILTLGLCIWPLIAQSWRGLLLRQGICIILVLAVLLLPSSVLNHRSAHEYFGASYHRRSGDIYMLHYVRTTVVMSSLRAHDIAVENFISALDSENTGSKARDCVRIVRLRDY